MIPLAFRSQKTRPSLDDLCASPSQPRLQLLTLPLRGHSFRVFRNQVKQGNTNLSSAVDQQFRLALFLFHGMLQQPDTHFNPRSLSTTLYNYCQLCFSSVLGDLHCIDWRNMMGFDGTTLPVQPEKSAFRRFNIEGLAPLRLCQN